MMDNIQEMGFIEGIGNRINALTLINFRQSVHTTTGEIGVIESVNVFKGEVLVKFKDDLVKAFPANRVADLDTPLPQSKK